MTMLQVKDLHKVFEGRELLKGVSFSLSKGEIICLLGPSGSGKSTLLRIIAGLEFADSGQVTWDGMDISQTPTHLRNFGMMFQDYALFSHLTVGENIAFGLRMQKMNTELIQQRVENVAGLTQLQGFINRGVTDLSGGEQQRVALARALAPNPRLMMLDEPLGALDRKLKEQLLDDLRAILKSSRLPTIYVTHDQAEAYAIADRILLLDDGVIVQDATPQQIYREPANAWVARFMGLGNVVQATTIEGGLQLPFGTLPGKIEGAVGQKRDILLRPDITIGNEKNGLQAKVLDVQFTGEKYRIEIEGSLVFRCDQSVKPGDMINITKIDWIILK